MGEFLTSVLVNILSIGIIFSIFVAIRNKWFRTKEYGTFEKRDIFILLLITYILLIFGPEDNDYFYKEILITQNYKPSDFIWIPFRFLALKQDFLQFQNYIDGTSTYYSLMTFSDYFIYYCKLIIIGLPIALLLYLNAKRKWIGFIFNIVILTLCFLVTNNHYIGDGLVMGMIAYLLVAIIYWVCSKIIKKDIDWLKYLSFGISVILVLILVVDFHFYFPSDVKLVKTISFERQFKTYDDLVTVNLEDVNLYKGGVHGEYLGFHGYLDCFSSQQKHSFFDYGLKFYDYETNYEKGYEFNAQLRENEDEPNYFEYYGISDMSIGLHNSTEVSGFELIEERFGEDKYLYYEIIYKMNKFKDFNIKWYVNVDSLDAYSNDIKYYYTDPEIMEETDEYVIKKERYYFYKVDREDIDRVETNVYGGTWYFDEKDVKLLFTIDKEMFD